MTVAVQQVAGARHRLGDGRTSRPVVQCENGAATDQIADLRSDEPPAGATSSTPGSGSTVAPLDAGTVVSSPGGEQQRIAGHEETDAFRTGAGMGWHEHHEDVPLGCEMFFRPGYLADLMPNWIPALDGVAAKLEQGARVAEVGCGLGASSVLLAQAYPKAHVTGSDYHGASIELARKRAADAGVANRTTFDVASAQDFPGTGYDLVATFDSLHDMGDSVGAARHIREALAQDGTWLIVEPFAGDTVAANLNPVGRVYYGFSTYLCVPNALSQVGGQALGAQAGETALRDVVTAAGFTRFRRVAETLQHRPGGPALSRMTIDCRTVPSDSQCTVALAGAPEELLDLAARHAVDVHGHTDGPELRTALRTALRAAMTPVWEPPTTPGAFLQVIEFATERIEEWGPIQERLIDALGPDRPMRWSVLTADRDRPGTHIALVEFASYEEAIGNSAIPATGLVCRAFRELLGRARIPQPRGDPGATLLSATSRPRLPQCGTGTNGVSHRGVVKCAVEERARRVVGRDLAESRQRRPLTTNCASRSRHSAAGGASRTPCGRAPPCGRRDRRAR